ncbi:MAG: LamG-like jellyroll fold domain-containing protein, partial [Acidimicrobiales bacterium]
MKHRRSIRAGRAAIAALAMAGGLLAGAVPASASTTTYTSTMSSLSPQAWWQLADPAGSTTASDSSGNGYVGTVSGAVTFGAPGPIASSTAATGASFNGGSVGTSLDPSGWTGITVGAWVYMPAIRQDNPRVLANSHVSYSGGGGFELFDASTVSPQGWSFALGTNSTAAVATTGSAVPASAWQFVVGTWSAASGTLTTYVNGTAAASTP